MCQIVPLTYKRMHRTLATFHCSCGPCSPTPPSTLCWVTMTSTPRTPIPPPRAPTTTQPSSIKPTLTSFWQTTRLPSSRQVSIDFSCHSIDILIYIYMSPKQHHICKSCLKIKMQLGLKHGASGAPCQCSNHWPLRPILMTNSLVVHSCNLGDINVKLWSFCIEKYYIRYIYVKKTWFGNDNGNLCYFT